MPTEGWRGGVNQILYGLEFTKELDDSNAALMANAMIEQRYFADGPQFYADVIGEALASDAVIMTDEWEPPYGRDDLRHSEEDIRQFLAMVAEHLRRRRPWPPAVSE